MAELVVRARTPGPAWWRVSKGDSVVWVLGVPDGLPRGTQWDKTVLAQRLTGAKRLILPPAYTFGVLDLFGALMLRGKLKAHAPIEASLPPDLRARYLAAAASLGQPPSHYDGWRPGISGLFMLADFRKRADIRNGAPMSGIKSTASSKGVHMTPAASHRAVPVLRDLADRMTPQVDLACLDDALKEIEAGPARIRESAQGWVRGDVPLALTAARGFEECLASFPEFRLRVRQDQEDYAAAIARELATPGVSVAAIPLRSLVAEDGVLEKLKAQGFDVRTPATD